MPPKTLNFTEDDAANRLLASNPTALIVGMLLDQQVPMEWAFHSPYRLQERLGTPLSAQTIADLDPEALESLFREPPALHRYPGSMAKRVHDLCSTIVAEYDGDAAAIWKGADDGKDLFRRLTALPGFGKQKAQIFTALLGKLMGVELDGWEEAAGDYGKPGHRSIADVVDADSIARVREYKQMKKAAKKK